jgi:hypothetical protein
MSAPAAALGAPAGLFHRHCVEFPETLKKGPQASLAQVKSASLGAIAIGFEEMRR